MSAAVGTAAAGAVLATVVPVAAGAFDNTPAAPPGDAAHGYGSVRGLAAACVGASFTPVPVTIDARQHGHVVASETVPGTRYAGNSYRLRLPAGKYVISAPGSYLPARTVTVRAGEATHLSFVPYCK